LQDFTEILKTNLLILRLVDWQIVSNISEDHDSCSTNPKSIGSRKL